jgi:aminopeptidase YwaD
MKAFLLRSLSLIAFAAPLLVQGQVLPDSLAIERMRADVKYLASEELEGREAGTPGERLAAEFIAAEFERIGLEPKGNGGSYLQSFTFQAPPVAGPQSSLQIGRSHLKARDDFFPISISASGTARGKIMKVEHGIHAPDLGHDDYKDIDVKGYIVAMNIGSPDGVHPHSKFLAYHDPAVRVAKAVEMGALGVVLYNEDATAEAPGPELRAKVKPSSVPVVFLNKEEHHMLLVDNNPCVITADIKREERTAYNVVGLLDHGVGRSTVVGAHYDHLGWGDEGSRHRGEPAIHHGADDNASGTAVLMQLARDLKAREGTRSSDHLFIAFSGEEKGLYGSNYWTKNSTYPLDSINYMLNLDMVGMLDSLGSIGINGVGTSPSWSVVDSVVAGGLTIKTTLGGIGSSDHTSFYLQGIPAIHFFTGTHEHYHKPSDTWEKLNYEGMLRVTRFIQELMARLDGRGSLEFTRTEEENAAATPRFKVTMGVVPDYMFSGTGMRIDGVTEGKPAATAGLQKGDVVLRIGAVDVPDMMGYMKALGQFNKGDSAPVKILRDGKEVMVEVTF